MGNFDYPVSKGFVGYYASLPVAGSALIAVPLELAGMPTDAALKDCTSLAAIKAIATEQTVVGRKVLTTPTSVVDYAADERVCDFTDDTFPLASGNPIGALVICYRPASGSADSAIIPLTNHVFVVTPNGQDIALLVSPSGFFRQ